jgi:hypothetical protein
MTDADSLTIEQAIDMAFELGFQHAWDGMDWRPENDAIYKQEMADIIKRVKP